MVILATKTLSCCRRTLQGEGHSVAGWSVGGFVELLLQVQRPFIRAMGGCYAVPPTANAGRVPTGPEKS